MPFWARVVFCLLGLAAIATGINIFLQNLRLNQWKTTQGKVLASEVTGFDEDFITIKYEYGVLGRKYIGDRFNVSKGSVAGATEVIKRYQPGSVVDVLYNPDNPQECALVRDHPGIPILMGFVGLVMLAFGLFASF